jgi:hypothetical protein
VGSAALQPDEFVDFLIAFPFNHSARPVIKSGIGMELFLNSAWSLVAIISVCLWLRLGRRATADRRTSFVGLVMLIVILFPVISVSDDLWSIQNPAETDTCQRRDHLAPSSHCLFPVISALPLPAFCEPNFEFGHLDALFDAPSRAIGNPALFGILNRPPPAA